MVKTKRNSIISLCLVLVLMLSVVAGFLVPQKSVSAVVGGNGGRPAVEGTDFDKITLFEGSALKSGGLSALCKRLLKSTTDKTLDDIESALENDTDHAFNASDIRDGNKGVVVSFGGYDWWVVYLTKSKTDDVIATLYMVEPISDSSGSYIASTWSSDWYSYDATLQYPSNMYGTSYIRAYINNGGSYAQAYSDSGYTTKKTGECTASNYYRLDTYTSSSSNPFASVLALSDYIATPSEVTYQATESAIATLGESYLYPNEAYEPQDSGWYTDMNYSGNTGYTDWQDDYIWLPSNTETGYYMSVSDNKQGIWSLNEAETRFRISYAQCWLRSGDVDGASDADSLRSDGNDGYWREVSWGCGVRPALHLNLSALSGESKTGAEIVVLPLVVMILSGFGIAFVNLNGNKKRARKAI